MNKTKPFKLNGQTRKHFTFRKNYTQQKKKKKD